MTLSFYQRYEIVFLHEYPLGPKLGLEKTATYVGCSKPAVIKVLEKFHQNEDLNDLPKSGHPRITTPVQDKKISNIVDKQTYITSTEIKRKLEDHDIRISESTIKRRLVESGAKYMNGISKPLLSERHRRNRL